MNFIKHIPFFIYVFVIYNILLFFDVNLTVNLLTFNLISGAALAVNGSDCLLSISVFMLYFEIWKSTKSTRDTIFDHLFSTLVFVAFLIEFLVYPKAGNSTFLIIMLMSFLDVVSGFTISISTARRDFTMGQDS